MKRLAMLLVLAATPAVAQRTVIADTIGFRDKALVERMSRVRASGDKDGFAALTNRAIGAGACRGLDGGARVRVEEADDRLDCLAPLGSPEPCLWTPKGQTKP